MKKYFFALLVVATLTFGVVGTLAVQGSELLHPDASQITLGTAFTYQGVLRRSSGAVSAVCDMAFRLHSLPIGGPVIGSAITTTVPITNGQFIVGLDFGSGAFTGEERYLDILVRCAPETAFTTLTPRQRISSVPYALALPGLYTLPNSTSSNVIGGYHGNIISDSVVGAVIGGGGTGSGHQNQITADYSMVGGGFENWVLNAYATISGGATNRASGVKSTVPGGQSAHATHEGEFAYANGAFVEIGDAQTSMYVLKATTTNTTPTTLMKNGNETGISIASRRTVAFDILIVASNSPDFSGTEAGCDCVSAGFRIQGVIQTTGGLTMTWFADPPIITTLGDSTDVLSVAATANDAADRLDIRVTGNDKDLRWVATVRTTEVAY